MTTRSADGRGLLARHKALVILLVCAGILLGLVAGAAVYVNRQLAAVPRLDFDLNQPGTGYERPPSPSGDAARAVNILLAGVDAGQSSRILEELRHGPWVPGSHRTDAIMILHIDGDRRHAYVISVPRDTWVSIDGYGMAKINAAFSYGGPQLFARTMEEFTGLRMNHFAIVDWAGFKSLTDALGGVTIQASGSNGTTTMDGKEALAYVRERYSLPRGDLDRIQRQQNVLRALSSQVASAGVLANPVKLDDVIKSFTHNVAVDKDLGNQEFWNLAMSLRHLKTQDLTQLTIPVKRFATIDHQSVVIIDKAGTKRLFGAAIADELGGYLAHHTEDTLPAPGSVN